MARAIDLHTRRLVQGFGLAGFQIALLRKSPQHKAVHTADLVVAVSFEPREVSLLSDINNGFNELNPAGQAPKGTLQI